MKYKARNERTKITVLIRTQSRHLSIIKNVLFKINVQTNYLQKNHLDSSMHSREIDLNFDIDNPINGPKGSFFLWKHGILNKDNTWYLIPL